MAAIANAERQLSVIGFPEAACLESPQKLAIRYGFALTDERPFRVGTSLGERARSRRRVISAQARVHVQSRSRD